MARFKNVVALSVLTVLGGITLSSAAPADTPAGHDCTGSPPDAITALPAPLNKWGKIVCTPYGHILASREGWMWLLPDLDPVLIPAQVPDSQPEKVGNSVYFNKIEVARAKGEEFEQAYGVFHKGFDDQEVKPDAYRVEMTTAQGKSLKMYFFDYDSYAWGMECPGSACDADTRFMILDMKTPPKARQPSI
jgi:hypothetical protein